MLTTFNGGLGLNDDAQLPNMFSALFFPAYSALVWTSTQMMPGKMISCYRLMMMMEIWGNTLNISCQLAPANYNESSLQQCSRLCLKGKSTQKWISSGSAVDCDSEAPNSLQRLHIQLYRKCAAHFFLVTWGKSNKSDTYTDWNKVRDSVLIVCHHSTKYPTLKTAFRRVSGENTDAEKVTRALPVVQGQQCGTDGARCDSPRGQRTKTATFFIFKSTAWNHFQSRLPTVSI